MTQSRRLNPLDAPHRFYRNMRVTDMKCWEWTGTVKDNGYASVFIPGHGTRNAHRALYELMVGPVPEGMQLDHLCRNRACINPDHLDVVTPRENVVRGNSIPGMRARQTHCKRGHKFTEKNTRYSKFGHRVCRICDAARARAKRRNEVFA